MEKGDDSPVLGIRRRIKRNAAPTAHKKRKIHRDHMHLLVERPIELNFERNIYKIYCKEPQYHQDTQHSFERPELRENLYPESHAQLSSNPQYNMSSQLPKSNLIEGVAQSLLTKETNKETAATSKVSYLENILKSQSYLEEYMYWQHGQVKSITQKQYPKAKETNLHPHQMFLRSDEQYHQVSHPQDVRVAPLSYLTEQSNPNFNCSYGNSVQNYFPQDQYNRNTDYSYPYEQRRLESNHTSSSGPEVNITNKFSAPASIGHLNKNQHAPTMTVIRTTGGNPIDIQVNNYYKESTRNPSSGQHSSKLDNTQRSRTFNTTAPNNCKPCADRQYAENQNNGINRPYIIATRRISSNHLPKKLPPMIVGRILEDPTTGVQYIEQFPNINNERDPLQNNAYLQNTSVEENHSYNIPRHIQENQLPTNPYANYSQTPNFGNYTKGSISSQKPRNRRNIPLNVQPEQNTPNLIHTTAVPEHFNGKSFSSTFFNSMQETGQRSATMNVIPPNKISQSLKDLLPPINVTLHNKDPKSLKELLTPLKNDSNPADRSGSCQCLHGKKPVYSEYIHQVSPVVQNPYINKLEDLVRRPTAQIGATKNHSSTATTTSTENRPFVIQSNNDQTSYIANINKEREVAPIVVYSSDEETLSIPVTDIKNYQESNHPENNTVEGDTVLPCLPQDENIIQIDLEIFTNQEILMQNTTNKEEIEQNCPENPTETQPVVDQNWEKAQLRERQEAEIVLKQKMTRLYKKIKSSILKSDKLFKEVYDASIKFDEAYKTIQRRMCDYLVSTNQAAASTSKDASDKSNNEENNDSEERNDEVIETQDEKSNAEVIDTYNDESKRAVVNEFKTEIIHYKDKFNAEVKESYDDESNAEDIKTNDDKSNAGVTETNNEEKPDVQLGISDTEWTLKHTEPSREVVELVLNSGIYIDFSDLSRCKKDATDSETLAEMLLTSIFTEKALKDCSLTGDSSIDTNAKKRPGLDAKGRIALITFVDEYANEVGWPEFKLVQVINRLQKKILDLRSDGQNVE